MGIFIAMCYFHGQIVITACANLCFYFMRNNVIYVCRPFLQVQGYLDYPDLVYPDNPMNIINAQPSISDEYN